MALISIYEIGLIIAQCITRVPPLSQPHPATPSRTQSAPTLALGRCDLFSMVHTVRPMPVSVAQPAAYVGLLVFGVVHTSKVPTFLRLDLTHGGAGKRTRMAGN